MENPTDDFVQFGCLKCKTTKKAKTIDAYAEKTLEAVVNKTFDWLQIEALDLGVVIDDQLKLKMLQYLEEQSMIPKQNNQKNGNKKRL